MTVNAYEQLNAALSGRYTVERELGAGGMATVYLAHDVRHDRKVALKVLRPELSAILGAARFLAEIKTTANLQHPHILSLFDSGEADGTVFYVMPYVEGESLRDRIKREQQLPIDDALRIAREVLDALEYAHKHGIVHRDIKPENILLHGGHAMVADFGIALAASKVDSGSRMTETGMSLGTPHYMSPEQAMGERVITPRADVYALGCVLYEMLTGEPPFTGSSAQAVFARVLTDDPRPLTLQRKTIPPHVADAVQMALQKLPADRFASAGQFADALGQRDFVAPHTLTSARSSTVAKRSSRVTLALAATTVVAAVAALAGWFRGSPEAPVTRYTVQLEAGEVLGTSEQSRVAVAPDGSVMVYEVAASGGNHLMLRRRDALKAEPINGTETATNPFFSPTGAKLGFVTATPRALRVMPVTGGPAVTIADSLVDFGGASWGHDGYIYYDAHLAGDGIARVRETGGPPESVTRSDSSQGELWHFQPEALPNGRGVLFTVAVRFGGVSGEWWVGATKVGTGKHRRLVRGRLPRFAQGYLFFVSDDGVLMAVRFDEDRLELRGEPVPAGQGIGARFLGQADLSVSRSGTLAYSTGFSGSSVADLVWVTREGRVTPVDTNFRRPVVAAALSPDGKRVAVSLQEGERLDVWVKELDRGPAVRISFDDARNTSPTWSPDGKDVFFTARSLGREVTRLMRAPADGSALPVAVRSLPTSDAQMLVSPDGSWVLAQKGTSSIEGARMTGDTAFRRMLDDRGEQFLVGVSPNGRWLAYTSSNAGQYEVYVRPFPDTRPAKRVISSGGITWASWSPAGDEFFYVNRTNDLIAVPMRPGVVPVLNEPRVLFNLVGARLQSYVDMRAARDGKRFLVVRPHTSGVRDEIVVVENFLSEVRAKAKR